MPIKLPYGVSNFADLRQNGRYYVDKTAYIAPLEDEVYGGPYALFLRPRRFGKSLWLSTLESYYDVAQAKDFDALFGGLAVHRSPTPLRGSYLVLRLDFSPVLTSEGPEALRTSFWGQIRAKLHTFLRVYEPLIPALSNLLRQPGEDVLGLLQAILGAVKAAGQRIYLFVDEYDNFLNDLVARGNLQLYEDAVKGTGFVRTFYKAVKDGTATGAIGRLYMTGVSPVTLDDLSSGFNIVDLISTRPGLNALCGFTQPEVEALVTDLLREVPEIGEPAAVMRDLARYYNGYRFSAGATERLYNPDMVLYFLKEARGVRGYPQELLDVNIRTDYGKLRQLASPRPGEGEREQRELLETILIEGGLSGQLVDRFGVRQMYERRHLVSLLYYMGLLTIGAQTEPGLLRLEVPNQVIRTLHWEELGQMMWQQAGVVVDTMDLQRAVARMAYEGDAEPWLDLIRDRVLRVLSNRDLMQFDEKHLKLLLLTYLTLSPIYRPLSEKEFAQGYTDLFLALDRRFPDARYAWMLELKHVRAGASEAEVERALDEATGQLRRYLGDEVVLPALLGEREVRAAALLFIGAKDYRLREVRPGPWRAPGIVETAG